MVNNSWKCKVNPFQFCFLTCCKCLSTGNMQNNVHNKGIAYSSLFSLLLVRNRGEPVHKVTTYGKE